jgi:hypothetical protein
MDAVVDPPLPEPQPAAAHIGVARLTPKAVVKERSALPEAPLPKPHSSAIASESPPLLDSLPPQLRSRPSRARGRSSASPALCANGSRTWSGARAGDLPASLAWLAFAATAYLAAGLLPAGLSWRLGARAKPLIPIVESPPVYHEQSKARRHSIPRTEEW